MSFAEKGAVGDIDPAFFVGYLYRLKATGTLKFEDAPTQRAIYLREGRVLFASSNAAEDQLGAILIAAGKVTQVQFDALVAGLAPKQSIASALSQGGHVSQRDIGDAARRKVEQIVGACCAQTAGQYEFEDGVLPKGALDLKLTTERVLIAAFEALEPSGFLIRILKSPVAVLAAAEGEPVEPELVRLREAFDGASSLADLSGAAGLTPAATDARAAVLVVLGMASVVTSQIEEMTLPDTRETASDFLAMEVSEAPAVFESETIGFEQVPEAAEPGSSGDATLMMGDAPSIPGLNVSAEATLLMGPGDIGGFGALPEAPSEPLPAPDPAPVPAPPHPPTPAPPSSGGSGDATLLIGSGLDMSLSPPRTPSSSGSFRMVGQKTSRATTSDLDAVKALIDRPTSESVRSTGSSAGRADSSAAGMKRPGFGSEEKPALFRRPAVQRGAAAALLAVVAAAGWMAYRSQAVGRTAATPGTNAPAAPVASVAVPQASAAPSTLPSALPLPSVAAAMPAAAPPAPVAKATPAISVTPAAVVGTPTPMPSSKAIPPPAPAPTIAAPASATQSPLPISAQGYEAMKGGRLEEASPVFASVARSRSGEYTIQILIACSASTIEKAILNDPSTDLFVLPTTFASRSCHRLLRGFFKTSAEAAQAVPGLPGYYATEGAHPRAVPVKSVLR